MGVKYVAIRWWWRRTRRRPTLVRLARLRARLNCALDGHPQHHATVALTRPGRHADWYGLAFFYSCDCGHRFTFDVDWRRRENQP